MYCKNCGEEIQEEAAICVKCGFANGTGTKFCGHCGKEVAEGQAICMSCGFYVNQPEGKKEEPSAAKSATEAICEEYRTPVRRSVIFSIVKNALTIAIVLAVLFAPIFTCERSVSDLTAEELLQVQIPESEGALEKFWTEGKIEQRFSLFEDMKLLGKMLFGEEGRKGDIVFVSVLYEGLFLDFILISMVMLTVMAGKQLFSEIQELSGIDQTTLLMVNQLKKSGDEKKKRSAFRQQTVYALFMYVLFDVVFSRLFGGLFEIGGVRGVRKMDCFSGVSFWFVLVLVLVVVYVVIDSKKKQVDKQMLLSITEKEYAEAQQ